MRGDVYGNSRVASELAARIASTSRGTRGVPGRRCRPNQQKTQHELGFLLVPGRGFEPRFTASKAAVLPLDDPGRVNDAEKCSEKMKIRQCYTPCV